MFDVAKQMSVQSYCFRHFKPIDALIAQIKGIGLSQVELCGVHVNFADEATFEPIIEQFKKAGVQICSISVQHFKGDPVTEEKWCKFCKMAGAKMLGCSFNLDSIPGSFRTAEQLAEKYDLLLGIHNHSGRDWLGNSRALDYVFKNTSPRVGLCLDAAWSMQAGEDPLMLAEKFRDRLYGVHVKDFIFHRTGQYEDVVVGTGNLKLREFMALSFKAPKLATVTLEYEGDVENPGPALRECVEKVKAVV